MPFKELDQNAVRLPKRYEETVYLETEETTLHELKSVLQEYMTKSNEFSDIEWAFHRMEDIEKILGE